MIVLQGGWPSDLDALLGPDPDAEFEEKLKQCRTEGHDLAFGVLSDGREFAECLRCRLLLTEEDR